MGPINVHAAPLPFSNFQVHTTAPRGASVADIVEDILPPRLVGKVDVVAMINGHIVFPAMWHKVRPKDGTIINIRAVPMGGGGGGGKNPLTTVLSIAVMIAAPYAAGALATNVGLSIFGGGVLTSAQLALTKGVLTAGFAVLGRLAVTALAPPPKPTSAAIVNNPQESPTQFIEGASNSLNPYGVVPVCLGTNRVFPIQAARPYTETENNDNYVRQLFTWGYGEALTVEDLKIGETDLDAFDDVQVDSKLAGNLHEGTSLFSNSVLQDNYNVLLDYDVGTVVRTLASNANEGLIDVSFPQGLMGVSNSTGGRFSRTVQFSLEYAVSGSGSWVSVGTQTITATQGEALIRSFRIVFPAAGDYDIRIARLTPTFPDNDGNTYLQDAYLSALRAVRYTNPVNLQGINGTAVRIRATDQLNGSIDQLNGIVSNHIPDYDADTETWITRPTSNPASIYRYVLQGLPNARALADSKLRIDDLEAWHVYCDERGYTYNRVIDYETSVEEILQDVASAGSASPAIVDGKRTVCVDREKDEVVQIVTPRNSWGYSGEMLYPEALHGLRVTFRNADKGYQQDERVVYADGYDETNATLFETLEVQSCTDSDLAYKIGRRMLAVAILRPETHSFYMDVENLIAIRGDRIKLENDIPLVGVGDARIKTVVTTQPRRVVDGGNPVIDGLNRVVDSLGGAPQVLGVSLDDTISIPAAGTYFMRIRLADGTQLYREISVSVGSFKEFTFVEPIAIEDTPAAGDLCYVVEAGGELDLVISKIEPSSDLTAKITALDYAPGIFSSEIENIPAFDSNITIPLEFIRPAAPVLVGEPQADETVLQRNPDGSFLSRAIFTLQNNNEGVVSTEVKIRPTGSTAFVNANVLEARPDRLVITGLQDGTRYDVFIRYRRANSTLYSLPLQINNFLYSGTEGPPSDVTGFRVSVTDNTAQFSWDPNGNVDFAFYRMRFSSLFEGATLNTAQILENKILTNRISLPFQGGTYFLTAVDLSGNESENAAVIITFAPSPSNAVVVVEEDPSFSGATTNVISTGGVIRLDDPSIMQGTYEFANVPDLGDVFSSFLSASIVANGVVIADSSSIENDVFEMDNLFDVSDLFGLSEGSWSITLEFRYTSDDPDASDAVWTDWAEFVAGTYSFRAAQFRLQLYSLEAGVSPQISVLSVTIDMPDRVERGNDLAVPVAGATIIYDPAFNADPAVVITLQDAATDDKIVYTSKDATGFAFKVYNATAAGYVERVYDYISSGYGRKETP